MILIIQACQTNSGCATGKLPKLAATGYLQASVTQQFLQVRPCSLLAR